MIRLQMLTLDMIDTVITDSAVSLPRISSDSVHPSTSDIVHLCTSDNFQPTAQKSSSCVSNNSNLIHHTNGVSLDHHKNSCVNSLKSNENSTSTRNDNDNCNFHDPYLGQEIPTRIIGQDFSRIRTSDRLRLRNNASKTL